MLEFRTVISCDWSGSAEENVHSSSLMRPLLVSVVVLMVAGVACAVGLNWC